MINKKRILIGIILISSIALSSFALWFTSITQGQTSIDATVWVNPPETSTITGQNFLINVSIDIREVGFLLYGYEYFFAYNSSQMSPVNASDGGFLMQPVFFSWSVIANVTPGIDAIDIYASTSDGGTSGNGTLTTIEFYCDSPGISILDLYGGPQNIALYTEEDYVAPSETINGEVTQMAYWEPLKLQHLVEWPYKYHTIDMPFVPPSSPEGYAEVKTELEKKGFVFDAAIGGGLYHIDSFFDVYFEPGSEPFNGTVASWWSSNTLEDGTRACLLSAEWEDGTSIAMGFVTNLLPPDQIPEIDPYIIYNAEPYFFIDFYWWAWTPVGKVIHFYYWWHNSHNHPNWFWGPYWWWRTYVKSYYYPYTVVPYWRPWWGWWWHWTYWRHWYWWSSYFPYDP